MDREYKEILFGAMFDELDRLQANKLYNNAELQKEALDVKGIAGGIGRGFQSLVKNPSHAIKKNVVGAYRHGAKGAGGVVGGVKNVLGTDTGKALAAGGLAAGGLLGTGYVLGNQRQ